MNKFNVGDKVKVVGNSYCHCFEIGQICIVAEAPYWYDKNDVEVKVGDDLTEIYMYQIMHNTDIELVK